MHCDKFSDNFSTLRAVLTDVVDPIGRFRVIIEMVLVDVCLRALCFICTTHIEKGKASDERTEQRANKRELNPFASYKMILTPCFLSPLKQKSHLQLVFSSNQDRVDEKQKKLLWNYIIDAVSKQYKRALYSLQNLLINQSNKENVKLKLQLTPVYGPLQFFFT